MSTLLTLTTDPIVPQQLVIETMDLRDDAAVALINSVSAMFLRYTGRLVISRSGTAPTYDTLQEALSLQSTTGAYGCTLAQ